MSRRKHKREKSMTSFKAISATGVRFFKYGIKRKPQITLVRVIYEGKIPELIVWNEGKESIAMEDIKLIAHGCVTRAFVGKIDDSVDPHCCFSIIPLNSTKSLDLQAASPQIAQRWVRRLRKMVGQTSREAQILSNAVLAETLTPSFNGDSITSAPLDDYKSKSRRPGSKMSGHVKKASRTLLSKDVTSIKNGSYRPMRTGPEDNEIFQNMFYRILRNHSEQQKSDIRKIVNPKFLYNTVRNRNIPKNQWETFITDEFGWALRSDLPISMSPFKMLEDGDESAPAEAGVESPAQKFMTIHNLQKTFNQSDFQKCLDTMNILIADDLVEETFDCIVEDGENAEIKDLGIFFGYVWGPRVDRVKFDILSWLENQINQDLETKMREALIKGKRYSTLDLRLAFGEDKSLSFMKKLYTRLLQEQEMSVEMKRGPASTSDANSDPPRKRSSRPFVMPFIDSNDHPSPTTQPEEPGENSKLSDFTENVTAPRSKAGTIVESIGDLSSESRDKFMKIDERIVNMETPSNDSESRTTDTSSTKKRDPSERPTSPTPLDSIQSLNMYQPRGLGTAVFENLMHRKVIKSRREDDSDDEDDIGSVRRTPSVLEAVRSVSSSVPRHRSPPQASPPPASSLPPSSVLTSTQMGGGAMPSDSFPKLPTPTPTFTKDSALAIPDNRDFDRRITEGAGSPGLMDASYSRRLTEGAQILDPKPSSYPKVSVGLFDILDAQHSHRRDHSDYSREIVQDSRSSTLSRVAGHVVNRIPGASQANQQVRLVSVTREKKQSEVKYCKLEEPASTAVAASDSPRSPKPASNDNGDTTVMQKRSSEEWKPVILQEDWKFPREMWMCFTILSTLDTLSDIYMAISVLTTSPGWLDLLILVFSFRAVLISWVLPNYTPFYEHSITGWTMLATWCPFSAIWHSAVPFPPKSSEELVQGLLHEFCVELVLIPVFTFLYIPFLFYVLFDSMQWSLSIFEQRYIFWNTIHLFECVPMFLTSIIFFISGFNEHPVVLAMILSALSLTKSVYVFRVHAGRVSSSRKEMETQIQVVLE